MRNRLFFFRSSAPSSGKSNAIPQPATEKLVYWENPLYWENPFESGLNSGKTENSNRSNRSLKGLISKARKQTYDFILSRCQSFSKDQSRSKQEMSRPKNSYSQKNHAGNGNGSERLSQSHVLHKTRSTDYDPDIPISIEDIYGGSLNGCPGPNSDSVGQTIYPLDGPFEAIDGSNGKNFSGFHKQSNFPIENFTGLNSAETRDDIDVELHRASKEAEERVALVSKELEQDIFLQDGGFGLPAIVQTIRDLAGERMNLALEVSSVLQHRIADRAAAKEELKVAKAELDARTRRLEREKELQTALEKELDRRSSDWTFKLEKYQSEEQRLHERVRELAEQNVLLQREVSSFHEREAESRKLLTYSELQTKDLTARAKEAMEENQSLQKNLSELQEKYRAAEEDRDFFKRNYEEKDEDSKELHKSITRLLRTCSEQVKTIDGLREGLSEAIGNNDRQIGNLQSEQMRLTGVEQALRRELESYRREIYTLRHENISLLSRLKGIGKEGVYFTFKLDQELLTRILCLQNQGLSLLNESTRLCSKLLDFIKGKARQLVEVKHGIEFISNGLDGQFIVESGMKIQGFKRGMENLTRSLQAMSALLHEKSNPAFKPQSKCMEDVRSDQVNEQTMEVNSILACFVLLKLVTLNLESLIVYYAYICSFKCCCLFLHNVQFKHLLASCLQWEIDVLFYLYRISQNLNLKQKLC